jgi:pimeloyl-ACP methyl ester carboxylesterase
MNEMMRARSLVGTPAAARLAAHSASRSQVRICFGTEDAMLGALTAPRFVAAIPGAQLIPLPGCGHVPMADNPGLVARAITEVTLDTGDGQVRRHASGDRDERSAA